MLTKKLIKLLTISSIVVFSLSAYAQPDEQAVSSTPKLLSEMTEEEKALLTEEELKALEEAEALIKQQQ